MSSGGELKLDWTDHGDGRYSLRVRPYFLKMVHEKQLGLWRVEVCLLADESKVLHIVEETSQEDAERQVRKIIS